MITRPLDLASKLRPEPRNFGALFFANAGLLVLFFSLCGSRFVLAPGMVVELPRVAGANSSAQPPTHVMTVTNFGQMLTSAGLVPTMEELRRWLKEQAGSTPSSILLVKADRLVPNSTVVEITGAAYEAGFKSVILAAEEPEVGARRGGR